MQIGRTVSALSRPDRLPGSPFLEMGLGPSPGGATVCQGHPCVGYSAFLLGFLWFCLSFLIYLCKCAFKKCSILEISAVCRFWSSFREMAIGLPRPVTRAKDFMLMSLESRSSLCPRKKLNLGRNEQHPLRFLRSLLPEVTVTSFPSDQ